jgi:hypothetical protein
MTLIKGNKPPIYIASAIAPLGIFMPVILLAPPRENKATGHLSAAIPVHHRLLNIWLHTN